MRQKKLPDIIAGSLELDDAIRRLAGVPKAEVDKEEEKWKRMQERLAAKRKAKGKKKR